jgi:dUTP pyrophosphatase
MPLFIKKLATDALLPIRKSEKAAGYDVYSNEAVTLPPLSASKSVLVSTGIAMTVPDGTYGQLAPRSGLSVKGIHVGAGVIDADYTGEVKVLLFNLTDKEITLEKHERIAQLIIKKIETPEVEEVEELGVTERGEQGFGSTGKS